MSHRDLQIVRSECESSRAGIACGQLRAVSTAERRGWHWPTNKDARRWPVCWLPRWPQAYLYALSGGSQVSALDLITTSRPSSALAWYVAGGWRSQWRSDREGKYMCEYSTEGLVADGCAGVARWSRLARRSRLLGWNSLATTCTLHRLSVGGFLDDHGCAERSIFT